SRICLPVKLNRVWNFRARAYLRALVRASCPMRSRFSCQANGMSRTLPVSLNVVCKPVPAVVFLMIPLSASQKFPFFDDSGKALGQGVVNVARHAGSLFQNGGLPPLLGELVELNGQHRLMSQSLRQLDFFRSVRRPRAVANSDETFHSSSHERRNAQIFLCSTRSQIVPKRVGDIRLALEII